MPRALPSPDFQRLWRRPDPSASLNSPGGRQPVSRSPKSKTMCLGATGVTSTVPPTPTGILARPISFLGKRSLSDSSSRTRRAIAPGSNSLLERSEEHTSELQSPCNLVCRLLLEKKKHISTKTTPLLRLRIVLYTP